MKHSIPNNHPNIQDYGPEPFLFNLRHATMMNENFRTTLWTGRDLQLTVMSIPTGGEIGAEMHPDVDQFLYMERGMAKVLMGCCESHLHEVGTMGPNDAFLIPAGTWHNIQNSGNTSLKIFSLYAPPQHPKGTIQKTKLDAEH